MERRLLRFTLIRAPCLFKGCRSTRREWGRARPPKVIDQIKRLATSLVSHPVLAKEPFEGFPQSANAGLAAVLLFVFHDPLPPGGRLWWHRRGRFSVLREGAAIAQ